jgi:hypothetical protein
MSKSKNMADVFPKHLFWDMDLNKLSLSNDKDIIIPRALFATTEETFLEDISRLEQFYSKEEILKYLKVTKERISNEVCAMVALRYNVPVFARFKKYEF